MRFFSKINGYRGHPQEIQIRINTLTISNHQEIGKKKHDIQHVTSFSNKQGLWDSMISCQRAQAIAFTVGASSTVGPHHRRSANNQSALADPRFVQSKHTMFFFRCNSSHVLLPGLFVQKKRGEFLKTEQGFSMETIDWTTKRRGHHPRRMLERPEIR